MTIRELAKRLELPLPQEGSEVLDSTEAMLECPTDSNCGSEMELVIRQYSLIYWKARRDGSYRSYGLIASAMWHHCSLLFYG